MTRIECALAAGAQIICAGVAFLAGRRNRLPQAPVVMHAIVLSPARALGTGRAGRIGSRATHLVEVRRWRSPASAARAAESPEQSAAAVAITAARTPVRMRAPPEQVPGAVSTRDHGVKRVKRPAARIRDR